MSVYYIWTDTLIGGFNHSQHTAILSVAANVSIWSGSQLHFTYSPRMFTTSFLTIVIDNNYGPFTAHDKIYARVQYFLVVSWSGKVITSGIYFALFVNEVIVSPIVDSYNAPQLAQAKT